MAKAAGYSGSPLAQKLGLKDGQRVLFIDLPDSARELLTACNFAEISQQPASKLDAVTPGYDVIHLFTAARAVLEDLGQILMDLINRNGMIWVSWPKKAARLATEIAEDVIRTVLLPLGLVDVKVCAIDQTWSGLKLVIRKELR
ncbi:MAG: DUF3052 domain-containing protein [Candidatus Devosia euplotis]|nr:DUF3052 domain-containing protein [Candidatus Devosia euplotis]